MSSFARAMAISRSVACAMTRATTNGIGLGSRAVAVLSRCLFEEREATSVALLTPVGNERAHRAYEKARSSKVTETLDTAVVDGERRMSWLMVLDRPLT